jgi:nucleotide-binding universal stress UspA family protein
MAAVSLTGAVVVGVDYSSGSLGAAEYAAWEARRRQVPLRVVHAATPPGSMVAGFGSSTVIEVLQRESGELLAETIKGLRARHPGVEIDQVLISSPPAGVLIDESEHAALVVVGARGAGGFAKLLLGSVATQVTTHASGPVVVVRAEKDAPVPAPGPVVVGVDGSDSSAAALGFAFDAAAARGAELIVMYAWNFVRRASPEPVGGWYLENEVAQHDAEQLLADVTAGWVEKYPDVRVTRRAEQADSPEATLLEAAGGASLLVVGSRGRGGFTGLLLGSVSRKLVAHATSTVAVVHDR